MRNTRRSRKRRVNTRTSVRVGVSVGCVAARALHLVLNLRLAGCSGVHGCIFDSVRHFIAVIAEKPSDFPLSLFRPLRDRG